MTDVHQSALATFGLKGRLAKLRTELTEAANAVDRWEEGKGSLDAVLQELRDVLFVWESVSASPEMQSTLAANGWHAHAVQSTNKLINAINDCNNAK